MSDDLIERVADEFTKSTDVSFALEASVRNYEIVSESELFDEKMCDSVSLTFGAGSGCLLGDLWYSDRGEIDPVDVGETDDLFYIDDTGKGYSIQKAEIVELHSRLLAAIEKAIYEVRKQPPSLGPRLPEVGVNLTFFSRFVRVENEEFVPLLPDGEHYHSHMEDPLLHRLFDY